MNVIGPHNLIESGTIRRCDFVGVNGLVGGSVSLWERVLRMDFEEQVKEASKALGRGVVPLSLKTVGEHVSGQDKGSWK